MLRELVPREGRRYGEAKKERESPGHRVTDSVKQRTYSLSLIRLLVTTVAVAK